MKTIFYGLGMIFCPALMAAVGNADLQNIRTLISEEKYEEALQKHLWFHEESRASPGMGGVRLSFALSQWVQLGEKYPKALTALLEIRDRHEARLLDGSGGFAEFHEYSAINRTLKEDQKTYTLFTQLHAKHPAVAKQCFDVAMDLIIQNKSYDLCAGYIGDPIMRYERIREMRELNLSLTRKNPKMDNPEFKGFTDQSFSQKTVQLIDILVNLKRVDEAREIQKRALEYFPTPEMEQSLAQR